MGYNSKGSDSIPPMDVQERAFELFFISRPHYFRITSQVIMTFAYAPDSYGPNIFITAPKKIINYLRGF